MGRPVVGTRSSPQKVEEQPPRGVPERGVADVLSEPDGEERHSSDDEVADDHYPNESKYVNSISTHPILLLLVRERGGGNGYSSQLGHLSVPAPWIWHPQ